MIVAAIIAVVCVLIEGFFSGSEIAIMGSKPFTLKDMAANGVKGAAQALGLRERPQTLLGTTLLGTNLSVVTATTFVTVAVIRELGQQWEWVAALVLSPMVLIFGELIPKTLYQQDAERMACRVSGTISTLSTVFRPFIWALQVLSSAILKLFHVDPAEHRILVTREDLLILLDGSADAGSDIKPEEEEMIEKIFELPDTPVKEVMIPLVEVEALEENETIQDAAEAVREHGFSRYPIYQERIDDIVGVLHVFDLLKEDDPTKKVKEISRDALFVPETVRVDRLLQELRTTGQNMAVVVDEYGGVEGIVTLEDILEEIVGEIDDEFDRHNKYVQRLGKYTYRINARVEVDHLNEALHLDIPEGDYETLGGFILDLLRRFPKPGEVVVHGDLKFTVTKVTDRSIREVVLDLPPHWKVD